MQQIFIELYKYKKTWESLPLDQRDRFVEAILTALDQVSSMGVEVVAYGANNVTTGHRAPYDFFCVYRVPNEEFQREFEKQVETSGWYDYFDQVNVSGAASTAREILLSNARLR